MMKVRLRVRLLKEQSMVKEKMNNMCTTVVQTAMRSIDQLAFVIVDWLLMLTFTANTNQIRERQKGKKEEQFD